MPKRTKKSDHVDEAAITEKPKVGVSEAVLGNDGSVTVITVKKQGELAGIEARSHPSLNVLMEEHATLSERMGTDRQRIGELNEQMLQEATKLKVTTYRHPTVVPELVLTVTERSAKVKVKKAKGDESEDEDE